MGFTMSNCAVTLFPIIELKKKVKIKTKKIDTPTPCVLHTRCRPAECSSLLVSDQEFMQTAVRFDLSACCPSRAARCDPQGGLSKGVRGHQGGLSEFFFPGRLGQTGRK